MNILYNSQHINHNPPSEIFNGDRTKHQEVPARVERILEALKRTDHVVHDVQPSTNNHELNQILAGIHSVEYLNFLEKTESIGKSYFYPSVFSYRAEDKMPMNEMAQRGFFSFDLFTPLSNSTFESALSSANLAFEATKRVLQTNEPHYALCRPPGHHAEPAKMGGYCYLNNGAVAVKTFKEYGLKKVALLDIDFHHGNGAEKIFAQSEDVLTISIHADPSVKFPYFSGTANKDYFKNINFPLNLGTNNRQYQGVLEMALSEIQDFGAEALVLSFGADTHESDPIGGFKLTTEYYSEISKNISELLLPTVILQEGGYNTSELGKNVVSFLSGF